VGGVLSITTLIPGIPFIEVIVFPLAPLPSTNEPSGREKDPAPSATLELTVKTPVNVAPGIEPVSEITVVVPSLSVNTRGPGKAVTLAEVVMVTETIPAAMGAESLNVKEAVGPVVLAPYSSAPMSQVPLRDWQSP